MEDGRNQHGRFVPGAKPGPGRPPGSGITRALKAAVSPEAVATFVASILADESGLYSASDKRWACEFYANRTEGTPVATNQNLNLSATASSTLPADFHLRTSEERGQILDEIRRRALEDGKGK